jgi:hypothetical protein
LTTKLAALGGSKELELVFVMEHKASPVIVEGLASVGILDWAWLFKVALLILTYCDG